MLLRAWLPLMNRTHRVAADLDALRVPAARAVLRARGRTREGCGYIAPAIGTSTPLTHAIRSLKDSARMGISTGEGFLPKVYMAVLRMYFAPSLCLLGQVGSSPSPPT